MWEWERIAHVPMFITYVRSGQVTKMVTVRDSRGSS